MADLKNLIEYQKMDIELYKMQIELEKYEHNKTMKKAKGEFAIAKSQVEESEAEAGTIVGFYEKAEKAFAANEKILEKLIKTLDKLGDSEEDEKERHEILAEIEKIGETLLSLEKELSGKKQRTDGVIKSYIDAQERGKKIREIYNSSKAKTEEYFLSREPQMNEYKEKLKAIEPKIQKEYLEQYKSLTAEKKYPALVTAASMDNGRTFTCQGCGIELSQKAKDALLETNISRCENCRRMIYKN